MALIVANTYQLTMNGTIGDANRPFANVMHFEALGTPITVQAAAEAFYTAYTESLNAHSQNSTSYESVSFVDLGSATGDSGVYLPPAIATGEANGSAVPPNTCVLATWIATGGRAYRNGRSYFPGADESSVDASGQLNAATVNLWQQDAELFLDKTFAEDLALCVVSRTSPSTGIARTVTGVAIQSQMATQRRRLRS